MCLGAVSAWYIGTRRERAPTPRPATQRPIMIWYQWVDEEICTIRPTEKTRHQKVTENRLPILSAMGAATSAPIKVPMESCGWSGSRS